MARQIWYAQDGQIWISGTYLGGGSNWTARVKEISITGGGRDVDGQRCFGSGANYPVYEKGQELFEASITTVRKDNYLSQMVLGGSPVDTTWPVTLTGDSLRYPVVVLYEFNDRFDDNGEAWRIKLGEAWCTGKEMSLNVDEHVEETFTFKCAPVEYQEEWTGDRTASGLTLTL